MPSRQRHGVWPGCSKTPKLLVQDDCMLLGAWKSNYQGLFSFYSEPIVNVDNRHFKSSIVEWYITCHRGIRGVVTFQASQSPTSIFGRDASCPSDSDLLMALSGLQQSRPFSGCCSSTYFNCRGLNHIGIFYSNFLLIASIFFYNLRKLCHILSRASIVGTSQKFQGLNNLPPCLFPECISVKRGSRQGVNFKWFSWYTSPYLWRTLESVDRCHHRVAARIQCWSFSQFCRRFPRRRQSHAPIGASWYRIPKFTCHKAITGVEPKVSLQYLQHCRRIRAFDHDSLVQRWTEIHMATIWRSTTSQVQVRRPAWIHSFQVVCAAGISFNPFV